MNRPSALVVDDDPDLSELIARVLTSVGFEVTTAFDAATAAQEARAQAPMLVTLDLSLPGASGTDLVREIRAVSEAHLLLVTGRVMSESDRAEARLAGADDIVIKPFSLRGLRERAALLLAAGHPAAPVAS